MKRIEAEDGYKSLLRCHLQFVTSGKQQSGEKRKDSLWAKPPVLISQAGTTVTVQLWKPPHKGPKSKTPGETGAIRVTIPNFPTG
jgi:hypothetical protein